MRIRHENTLDDSYLCSDYIGFQWNLEWNLRARKKGSEKSMFMQKATAKPKYRRTKRDEYFFIKKLFHFPHLLA